MLWSQLLNHLMEPLSPARCCRKNFELSSEACYPTFEMHDENNSAMKLNHAFHKATSLTRHKPNIYLLYPVNTQEKEERETG